MSHELQVDTGGAATDETAMPSTRTRRAVLTAVAAAGAATVASALAKPLPVAAAGNDGQSITVGGFLPDAFSQTTLANDNNNENLLWVASNANGANTGGGIAVTGYSHWTLGVWGYTHGGTGVKGTSNGSTGVHGESNQGWGVYGVSGANVGVFGQSSGNSGVFALSTSAGHAAASGLSRGSATGVQGHAGGGGASLPDARASTGVMGTAAGDGTGGYFGSPTGHALRVEGRASFNRSGRVSIPKNRNYVDITPEGGIPSGCGIVASLQKYRSGVWVAAVRTNYPVAGKARIQLNKVASTTSSTTVAWFAFG